MHDCDQQMVHLYSYIVAPFNNYCITETFKGKKDFHKFCH